MKNPHVLPDGNWKTVNVKEVSVTKKFKRKSREPVKRVCEVRSSSNDSKRSDSSGDAIDNICVANHQRRLPAIASVVSGEGIGHLGGSETALDMRINAGSAASGRVGTSHNQSLSEVPSPQDTIAVAFPQVVSFDSQQIFPRELSLHSRVALGHRSERPLSSTSQASSHISNKDASESPRKRMGEASGVVTEIKAIQQTRRLLANARERTRVHTISAAFEALRKQVPCYSYGQKLSKLAILRIACNYILSLAHLAELDYSPHGNQPHGNQHGNLTFRECVEQCTRTLQAEGRSKKRKE